VVSSSKTGSWGQVRVIVNFKISFFICLIFCICLRIAVMLSMASAASVCWDRTVATEREGYREEGSWAVM
jgi:hypothetical protein